MSGQMPAVGQGGDKCKGGDCDNERIESLAFCWKECRDKYFGTERPVNPILSAFRERFARTADINEFTPFGFFEAGWLASAQPALLAVCQMFLRKQFIDPDGPYMQAMQEAVNKAEGREQP